MTVSSRQLCVASGALLGAFLFVLCLQQASWAWGQDQGGGAAARLIVTYEDGVTGEARDGSVGAVKVEAEAGLPAVNAEVVSVPGASEGVRRAKEELEEEPGVETVEYDHAREAAYSPNDPGLSDQWGLRKTGFRPAWDVSRGDGARIAIVDSGITEGHPDLAGKVVAQRDFVNEDRVADDDAGHGTHVAGIAAARTGNGTGISGGCPGCEILVAKTMQGRLGYDSDVAEGIIWAADNGADVINLSLTGPAPSDILRKAVNYAWNEGAVVVAASGNTGDGTVQYPASYENAIAVSATNRSDGRASFSTLGDWVDVAAPGVGTLSTLPGGYGYMNGTSMATPHVAALAALLASEGLSNGEIRDRITSSTIDLGPAGRDPYFGTGRIDAARALGAPANRPVPAPNPEPAPAPDPEPPQQPDAPPDNGGDNERTLASNEDPQPRDVPAPPLPPEPTPPPPTEEPRPAPAADEPVAVEQSPAEPPVVKSVVREAPPETAAVQEEAPLPQELPRELVFQNDEELEERFREAEVAERATAQPAKEDGCDPEATGATGEDQEPGLATAMIDGVLSAMRSVLEGLGLVSAAEAETASVPCAETAGGASRG